MANRIFITICVIIILISSYVILTHEFAGTILYITETNPKTKALIGWLNERDPEGMIRKNFDNTKEFFKNAPMENEGSHTVITMNLRGPITKFWINNETNEVDCYISYCGKNVGKKFCGDEIANDLCEQ